MERLTNKQKDRSDFWRKTVQIRSDISSVVVDRRAIGSCDKQTSSELHEIVEVKYGERKYHRISMV